MSWVNLHIFFSFLPRVKKGKKSIACVVLPSVLLMNETQRDSFMWKNPMNTANLRTRDNFPLFLHVSSSFTTFPQALSSFPYSFTSSCVCVYSFPLFECGFPSFTIVSSFIISLFLSAIFCVYPFPLFLLVFCLCYFFLPNLVIISLFHFAFLCIYPSLFLPFFHSSSYFSHVLLSSPYFSPPSCASPNINFPGIEGEGNN